MGVVRTALPRTSSQAPAGRPPLSVHGRLTRRTRVRSPPTTPKLWQTQEKGGGGRGDLMPQRGRPGRLFCGSRRNARRAPRNSKCIWGGLSRGCQCQNASCPSNTKVPNLKQSERLVFAGHFKMRGKFRISRLRPKRSLRAKARLCPKRSSSTTSKFM